MRPALMSPDDLVRQHADLAYRVCLRVTGNRDDAADATQRVLVTLWQRGADVPDGKRRAWTARVARNASLDLLRRRAVRPMPAAAELPELADRAAPPDAAAEASELRRRLDRAIGSLDEPYQSIVILREIEGLPYAEIADALGLPLNTLKVYLHRARKRLRAALRASAPDLVPSS